MAYEKKTRTLFYERFNEFLVMNEKEKAKKILKILNNFLEKKGFNLSKKLELKKRFILFILFQSYFY